jgi:transcriptional regulator with XRE-family HTH domain
MTSQPVGGRTYEFGLTDRLRISRELANYGQREFAEATGISRSSIANYENGTTTPRRPQLIAWAMATGFSLTWLETGVATTPDGDGDDGARKSLGVVPAPTGQYGHLPANRLPHLPEDWLVAAQTNNGPDPNQLTRASLVPAA